VFLKTSRGHPLFCLQGHLSISFVKYPEVTCCSAYKNILQLCSAKSPVAAALPRNADSTHETYCTVSLASNVVQLVELNNMERTNLQTGQPRTRDSIRERRKDFSLHQSIPRTVLVTLGTRGSQVRLVSWLTMCGAIPPLTHMP
jgi:hypothetical protein